MSNVICLGGGVESVPMVQRVQELGHRAIVVDGNPNAPAFKIADRCSVVSCYTSEAAIRDLKIIGERYNAVLCCGVDAPVACAEIALKFGLPGLSVGGWGGAIFGQNKLLQKEALHNSGMPVPRFSIVVPGSRIEGWMGVIKPVDSRGGRGVIRLLPGVYPVWSYEQAKAQSPTGQVMVEQWLDGPQLSTESVVQDGRVLFTAIGLRNYARLEEFAPYCIEDGFDEPYRPGTIWSLEVNEVIEKACAALGWYQNGAGTVKGDLVIHDGKLFVIELACRLSGGFFATHGHPLAYGVDFVGAAIRAALGEQLEMWQPGTRHHVSQRYVFPKPEDVGKTVTAIEDDGVTNFHTWNIKVGDVVQPVTCHPARWGQVIATGQTAVEAREKAEAAVKRMYAGVILT